MKCRICGQTAKVAFSELIRDKYNVEYFYCNNCNFIQTEEPFWLEEAYSNAINPSDTGIFQRNYLLLLRTAILYYFFLNKEGVFLDWGGGYGIFTRLMRDIGFDSLWNDRYSENIFAKGFEYSSTKNTGIEAVSCFEVFEHIYNPIEEFEKLLSISDNILIGTELFPGTEIPEPDNWYYYGFSHGQHISFYSLDTLMYLAKKFNLNLVSNGYSLHFFSKKRFRYSQIIKKMISLKNDFWAEVLLGHIKKKMNSRTMSDSKMMQEKDYEI